MLPLLSVSVIICDDDDGVEVHVNDPVEEDASNV